MKCDKYLHIYGTKCGITVEEIEPFGIWILCSEKLPEIGEDVLVSVDTAESGKCWVTIAYMCHDFTDNEYWFQNDEMNFDMDEVLAWMPLPDAYEEDE